jgi:PEP-CTERM motif
MRLISTLITATLLAATAAASAAPITPSFSRFGTLAGATFGGSGIPNTAVAVTEIRDDAGSEQLTLGLTAHQRFVGPNLANNGAGVFSASTGVSPFPPSPGDPYAVWNFALYVSGMDASDLNFKLFYDFDPAAGNDQSTHGVAAFAGGPFPAQNSFNLGMNFLAMSIPGITPPAGSFDPNVAGEYSFALEAYTGQGRLVARTAIVVNVADGTVPEPGTLVLTGLALLAGAARSRRRT